MGNSAFAIREITICICNNCVTKGAKEFCLSLDERLKNLKMAQFFHVRPLRLKESHSGEGLRLTVDGMPVSEVELDGFLKLTKTPDTEPFA